MDRKLQLFCKKKESATDLADKLMLIISKGSISYRTQIDEIMRMHIERLLHDSD